jgi:Ni/Co efflux regulator RcnB
MSMKKLVSALMSLAFAASMALAAEEPVKVEQQTENKGDTTRIQNRERVKEHREKKEMRKEMNQTRKEARENKKEMKAGK